MAAGSGRPFKGALLSVDTSGATVVTSFTTIAEITSIDGPNITRDVIDVTHTSSDADCREFRRGLIDGGTITFNANFLPGSTTQTIFSALAYDAVTATTTPCFCITCTDGTSPTTWSFFGIANGWSASGDIDSKHSATGSIKVTGTPKK